MQPLMSDPCCNEDFIINMASCTTLYSIGARSINVRSSTSSTLQVTVAVTVTVSGLMLSLLVVYKGARNGRITRQFGTYPEGSIYACQSQAWMDGDVMKQWVDTILIPYCSKAPDVVQSLLLCTGCRTKCTARQAKIAYLP